MSPTQRHPAIFRVLEDARRQRVAILAQITANQIEDEAITNDEIKDDLWCPECGQLRMKTGQQMCDHCQAVVDADEGELEGCRRNRLEYR